MPALENPKHERFSQELAKGKTADEAYQNAGYKANRGNAATLKANQNVSDRVAEIQERVAMRTEITVAGLTKELQDILTTAKAGDTAGHLNAARQSVMDIAKLNGLVVDKSELAGKDGGPIQSATSLDVTRLNDDQLRALASIKLSADA